MKGFDFREIAIESAQNYYDLVKKMKKGRSEVRAVSIMPGQNNCYEVALAKKDPHIESAQLQIISPYLLPEHYDTEDENYIKNELFTIQEYNEDGPSVSIQIREDFCSVFEKLSPREITFVSDLTFLIKNVRKWYEEHGATICLPGELKYRPVELHSRARASKKQKESTSFIFDKNVSYVWGAPGTGKTQIVLADSIITHIKNNQVVFVLATTNNALEQMLRAVIKSLEEENIDYDCLYRRGVATTSFAREYGSICERENISRRIERAKKRVELDKKQLEEAISAQRFREKHSEFKELYKRYQDLLTENRKLLAESDSLSKSLRILSDELKPFKDTEYQYERQLLVARAKLNSVFTKISAVFSPEKKLVLEKDCAHFEREIAAVSKEIAKRENKFEALKNEANGISSRMSEIKSEIVSIEAQFLKITEETLQCQYISPQNTNDAFRDQLNKLKTFEGFDCDREFKRIHESEEKYKQLLSASATQTENKLVHAFTLDYFYAHYNQLLGVKGLTHVFLDEAAYCPMIKAGILFSMNVPVTMFGDHMQLPPICEASSKDVLNNMEQKIYLWSLSALYMPEALLSNTGLKDIFISHGSVLPPNETVLHTCFLNKTFRFGNNLARLLDEYIYRSGLEGQKDFDTDIIVIDAPRVGTDKALRENNSEVEAIKKYIDKYEPNDFAIMSPYRAQRDLLTKKLFYVDRDNIMTVHASQGREWDTVIFSVTDTKDKFMVDSQSRVSQGAKLINTAISRAKKRIVIVCDCSCWLPYADEQLIGKLVEDATEVIKF